MPLLHEPLQAWRDVTELHPVRDVVHVQQVDSDHLALQYLSLPGPHGSHGYVLRVSPDEAVDEAETAKHITLEEAHALAMTQRDHLQTLGQVGLHIPQYSSFIGHSPAYDSPALFNLVDRKDAMPVSRCSLPTCKLIGQALTRYLTWVEQTEQPLVFDDIYKPRQYGVKPQSLGFVSDSRIWLLDIEPSFVDPNAKNHDGITFLQDFQQRAEALQRF